MQPRTTWTYPFPSDNHPGHNALHRRVLVLPKSRQENSPKPSRNSYPEQPARSCTEGRLTRRSTSFTAQTSISGCSFLFLDDTAVTRTLNSLPSVLSSARI